MKYLKKYFELMERYPSLFANPIGKDVIRVVTDPKEIISCQKKLQAEYKAAGKPISWIDIGLLVDDPWYLVVRDLVEFPGGYMGGYIRFINRKTLEGGTSVVILPVQDGKIVLISHFRHETRRVHWELPAGFGESGLGARENALKELSEEIGIIPNNLIEMTTESEGEDSRFTFFYAELDPRQKIKVDISEGIGNYVLLGSSEYEEWIKDGKITDSNAVKAYVLAIAQGHLGRN